MQTFEREAQRTMQKISQAGATGSAGFASASMGTNIKRNTDAMVAGATRASTALDRMSLKQKETATAAALMGASFSRAADALQIVQGPLGPLAGRLSALGQALRSLVGFSLASTLAGGGAFALGAIATSYQKMHDTLVPLFDDQTKLNRAMGDVIGIAQRTHQALQPVADLYAQISRVAKDAGLSQQRAARLTETVSKASLIGGGSTEARQEALVQFGQALTANFHGSGQELQSILEEAPALAQAIAKGLGTQASKLKQLAKDGQLSTEIVVRALEREADEIDRRFGMLPNRIGKALTQLENNLAIFVGRLDESTGATTGVANAISFLADHLRGVAVIAGTVATAFAANSFATAVKGATEYASRLAAIAPLTREQILFNQIVKTSLAERAAQELEEAQAQVTAAEEAQVQIRAQIGLLEKQIATQAHAVEMARTLDAAMRTGGGTGSSQVLVASYNDLEASQRALIATEGELAALDAELTAANERLAASTLEAAAADDALVAAETAAAAATGRLAAAKAVLQGAMVRARGAAGALSSFLGGPMGIAFAAATTAALVLASAEDAAKDAAQRFAGGQEELRRELGLSIDKLAQAGAQARQYALDLARADVAKAKSAQYDVGRSLASSLYAASAPGDLLLNRKDADTLRKIADGLRAGERITDAGQRAVLDIFARNQQLSKTGAYGTIAAWLGADPKDAIEKVEGARQAFKDLADAQKNLAATQKEIAKPQAQGSLLQGGTAPTKAALNAQAKILGAADALQKARAELSAAEQKGPLQGETNDQYIQRIAGLIQNVNSLVQARKNEAAATREAKKALAEHNKEMAAEETARDKGMRVSDILDANTIDSPIKRLDRLHDAAERAKKAIQDLVGERVIDNKGDRIFSQAEADRDKGQIDQYAADQARKPVTDAINQAHDELQVQTLIAQGLGSQAELVRQKLELEKQVGPLTQDELNTIADQVNESNRLNDVLQKRNAIIENNARFLDAFRDALTQTVSDALQGKVNAQTAKSFLTSVYQAFANAKANEIVMKLIGDPGQKYRDQMTRGLNASAEKLGSSAQDLSNSAADLANAAAALAGAGHGCGGGGGGGGGVGGGGLDLGGDNFLGVSAPGDPLASILGSAGVTDSLSQSLIAGMDPATAAILGLQDPLSDMVSGLQDATDAITITAKRLPQNKAGDITSMVDSLGGKLGSLIAGPNSVLTKVMGSLGKAMEGAGYGAAASGIFGSITGMKQSNVGSMIGGGIGGIAGSFLPIPFGSQIGSIVGGILGGTLGGILGKKPPAQGGIQITNLSGNYSYGGDANLKSAVVGAADDVTSGLQKVLSQLGGTLGAFNVSIGKFDGDWRVNTEGLTGAALNRKDPNTLDFNDDYAAAVKTAIMNAIQDGAIQGIRESTRRLLMAGKDLDTALDKALKFEGVFKSLKAIKDPVGAAVDDLNTQFQELIGIFKEAGASAEEWGQLQELYDYQRADAIKQATQQTIGALQDFITQMTSGSESPLSKQTVYGNAKAAVDAFRSDIAAGKTVDQQDLVTALQNFEQASQDLYGSRAQFYTDFQDVLSLANEAKSNAEAGSGGVLPPSPFDNLTPIAQQQLTEQQATNDNLTTIISLLGGSPAGGGGAGSTIGNLPGVSAPSKDRTRPSPAGSPTSRLGVSSGLVRQSSF